MTLKQSYLTGCEHGRQYHDPESSPTFADLVAHRIDALRQDGMPEADCLPHAQAWACGWQDATSDEADA